MLAPGGRILKGSFDEVSEVDYCKLLGSYLDQICVELIRYRRHNRLIECCLPKEQAILQLPPLNLLTQLEILVWHPRKAMFLTSIKHDAQEPINFGIKKVGMIGFGFRPQARRCMVH